MMGPDVDPTAEKTYLGEAGGTCTVEELREAIGTLDTLSGERRSKMIRLPEERPRLEALRLI